MLLFTVFLTGAGVLIIEIVASRILSPFFGNTIYTYSAIISTILAALSFGYYFGGILADKKPSEKIFFFIIFVAGILVLLIEVLITVVLQAFSKEFSLVYGPLVFSVLLFFVPSFLLGMLSPYVIKLQHLRVPKEGIGKVSGEVFFFSTLGSIFGSIVTGFYLIPNYGVDTIILGTGFGLVVIGVAGLMANKAKNKTIISATVIFVVAASLAIELLPFRLLANAVYNAEGLYEHIAIVDYEQEDKRPVRYLLSERNFSSGIFLDSDEHLFDYSKYFSLYELVNTEIENVLILGAGAFTLPRAYMRAEPQAEIDAVEIEPSLYELSKKYFRLKESPRLHSHVEDARRFMLNTDKKYDVIFNDVYLSIASLPVHATTKEYFELAKERMDDNGIFIANFIGDLYTGEKSLMLSLLATLDSVFDNYYLLSVKGSEEREVAQNYVFFALNSDERLDFSSRAVTESETEVIRNIEEHLVDLDKYDFSDRVIFTDNYAPVEMYTAGLIKRIGVRGL